jgi:signal transduction histidine kinase
VCLTQPNGFIQLVINDDGIGFNPDHLPAGRKVRGGLGLLGMRERATYVNGAFKVKSGRRAGTEIEVRIPLADLTLASNSYP